MMEALLSKDPIVTCLYRRKTDGKFLVCKSKYNKKIGLPIVKILVSNYSIQHGKATSKDVSVQVVNAFRKEFGLDPEILNYYEGTKTSFVNNGVILNGNNIAFDMTDAGEYKGKPTITQNPSGDYTEVQWMSYNQILELVKTNLFDSSSLYYVLRSREQHRIKPILDSRLSLRVYADKTGLKIYNDPADPMPLNISGGKTLDECKVEETEDYIIYADGGTQVRMGRTGLAQKYIEALNAMYSEETAKGTDILAKTHMTSDVSFHSNLLDILNEEHNKELEAAYETQLKTRNVAAEEPYLEPLSEQRVFVAINFACRIDKKSGEIYIGEGYENLFSSARNWSNTVNVLEATGNATEGWYTAKWIGANRTDSFNPFVTNDLTVNSGDVFSFSFKCETDCKINQTGLAVNGSDGQFSSDLNSITASTSTTNRHLTLRYQQIAFTQGWQETVYNICITKTSTPKPFVKSVMPSGKLAFVTPATSETHSFVMKEITSGISTGDQAKVIYAMYNNISGEGRTANYWRKTGVENIFKGDMVYSSIYNNGFEITRREDVPNGIYIGASWTTSATESFSTLLIYKGNLTESELKAENGKLDFIQFEL